MRTRTFLRILSMAGLLAAAQCAQAHACAPHVVQGAIADRYRQLGGETGPLGCPVDDEADANNGARQNHFEHGEIAWAPRQGSGMTIAAWQAGDSVWLKWGRTDAHFDKFLVRYDYQHQNIGQDDWAPGNDGSYQLNATRAGNYGFSVQGCNGECQGWGKTVEVYVDVADPQGVAGDVQVVKVGPMPGMQRTLFERKGFLLDAFNRAWALASGPLCDGIEQHVGGADAIGPGYTLHPDMVCRLAPRGVLFVEDASGADGAVDLTFDVPHNYFEATTTQPSVFGSYVDPRFSFTYEIALHARLDPIRMQVVGIDYAVINPGKPDSRNASADVMKTLGPIVAPSVLRRVQANLASSGSIDIARINQALAGANAAIAPELAGASLRYASSGGNLKVTLSAYERPEAQVPSDVASRMARDRASPSPKSAPVAIPRATAPMKKPVPIIH